MSWLAHQGSPAGLQIRPHHGLNGDPMLGQANGANDQSVDAAWLHRRPELESFSTNTPATLGFDLFSRLVQTYREGARLQNELTGLQLSRDRARLYIASPESNRAIGLAVLERIETKQRTALGQLRALQSEALRLTGVGMREDGQDVA